MTALTRDQKSRMATGALSHIIGAYYLLGALACNCEPRKDPEMRALLLHVKGIFWLIMSKRYGIKNPKKGIDELDTKELLPPLRPMDCVDVGDTSDTYKKPPKRPGANMEPIA